VVFGSTAITFGFSSFTMMIFNRIIFFFQTRLKFPPKFNVIQHYRFPHEISQFLVLYSRRQFVIFKLQILVFLNILFLGLISMIGIVLMTKIN
jgi:hypothetical protein